MGAPSWEEHVLRWGGGEEDKGIRGQRVRQGEKDTCPLGRRHVTGEEDKTREGEEDKTREGEEDRRASEWGAKNHNINSSRFKEVI